MAKFSSSSLYHIITYNKVEASIQAIQASGSVFIFVVVGGGVGGEAVVGWRACGVEGREGGSRLGTNYHSKLLGIYHSALYMQASLSLLRHS